MAWHCCTKLHIAHQRPDRNKPNCPSSSSSQRKSSFPSSSISPAFTRPPRIETDISHQSKITHRCQPTVLGVSSASSLLQPGRHAQTTNPFYHSSKFPAQETPSDMSLSCSPPQKNLKCHPPSSLPISTDPPTQTQIVLGGVVSKWSCKSPFEF
jgi:hypothetical protein